MCKKCNQDTGVCTECNQWPWISWGLNAQKVCVKVRPAAAERAALHLLLKFQGARAAALGLEPAGQPGCQSTGGPLAPAVAVRHPAPALPPPLLLHQPLLRTERTKPPTALLPCPQTPCSPLLQCTDRNCADCGANASKCKHCKNGPVGFGQTGFGLKDGKCVKVGDRATRSVHWAATGQ